MLDPSLARTQWNRWTCGPASLRCALLCYGDRVAGKRLAWLGGTTKADGTDIEGLADAALEYGFRVRHQLHRTASDASVALMELLRARTPVLLPVDAWDHWIVAVRCTSRRVWVCDPQRDGQDVHRHHTWRQLLRRLHWGLPDEIRFDLYGLVPS